MLFRSGAATVVGVNKYVAEDGDRSGASIEVFRVDPELEVQQVQRVQAVRASRDAATWKAALEAVRAAAATSDNLVPHIINAVEAKATVGEIADTMRSVFGEYREVSFD